MNIHKETELLILKFIEKEGSYKDISSETLARKLIGRFFLFINEIREYYLETILKDRSQETKDTWIALCYLIEMEICKEGMNKIPK